MTRMIRVFEIEFDDELGPFWMKKDNLLSCINAYFKGSPCKAVDITDFVNITLIPKEEGKP